MPNLVVRTPPGKFVELHVHPYSETFVLLEGSGRWTAGETVTELSPNQMLSRARRYPHGFRNVGDVPLLVVTVHESAHWSRRSSERSRPEARTD